MNEAEIVFILEPDAGRVTVETSRASANLIKEIKRDLGRGSVVNCARPIFSDEKPAADIAGEAVVPDSDGQHIYLFRLYHDSIVDGFGRRSVVQFAGCSIRCVGCYVPETHERENGRLTSIGEIVRGVDEQRTRHDGVTILGGEPFDQAESLSALVERLKAKNYHITVYSGYTLENLLARDEECVNRVLAKIDLLIDGAFDRNLTRNAGEYRGSSNQRLILHPISRVKMKDEKPTSVAAGDEEKRRQSETEFNQSMAECLDEGWSPTKCPEDCPVEPDGVCPHGFKSVALELGFI
jgi:anaerobic ribonucleoside-triphosphate reductase activating protein